MGKETVILAVSFVALLVAGYAVYTSNNSGGLASLAEINDYSKDFQSIQTTLEQLETKLEKLEADTTAKLSTIKAQVEELKENTSLEPVSIFGITLDQKIYSADDTIHVTAQVAAQKPVKIDLISYSGELISSRIPYSDSTGALIHLIQLPSFLSEGTYKVEASYNGQTTFQSLSISDSIVQTSDSQPTVVTQAFSVNLDKESYKPGETIRVSGFGQATESVSLKVTDPDGNITSAHSNSRFDGAYTMIYILSSNAENGDWKMTIQIAGDAEIIAFQVA